MDCKVHQHGITVAQMDRLINSNALRMLSDDAFLLSPNLLHIIKRFACCHCLNLDEVRSPFAAILPRECISYIIIVAYHICHKDIE